MTAVVDLAKEACKFLSASTDPFHAVFETAAKLKLHGFEKISPGDDFSKLQLKPGGKYYYEIHQSTVVAFAVGHKLAPGVGVPFGFHIIGGHTDSPVLKVKPRSKRAKNAASGALQLAVECYGGGLWHTWFDRDLGISGRVLVRDGDKIRQRLVRIQDPPAARVSTLAIHLQSGDERKAFAVNKETHTAPIIGMENQTYKELLESDAASQLKGDSWREGQEPMLIKAIAKELGCEIGNILDWEINLFDVQPASLGGLADEPDFLHSARLDNLATVFTATEALVRYTKEDAFLNSPDVSVAVFFDHEEVGSKSDKGAGSPVMNEAVDRIANALGGAVVGPDYLAACRHRSFILSVDQAHAVHPNYAAKHEAGHGPKLNAGVVVKSNSNQRYTTNGVTGFLIRELARAAADGNDGKPLPIQEFAVRNDCPCGSTIGPILAGATGIRAVDAGMPQWSMHSCREVMGVQDVTHGVNMFSAFYR